MKRNAIAGTVILAFTAVMGIVPALAADSSGVTLSTQSQQMDTLAGTNQGAVASRMSSDFSAFAGSTENSDALVTGLRNGTAVTLSSTDAQGTTATTTFTPPTGKMGYGNVYTSLALAKQNLAMAGITNPTPEQLQAALVGGTVTLPDGQTTTMTGVLELRAQGMGWGQIAQQYGYKLGPVISGMRASNTAVSAQATHRPIATTATGAGSGSGSGIVTGAGATSSSHGNAYGRGIVTEAGSAGGQGNAYGRGIVSGAGSGGYGGYGNAYGRGIVSGAGGLGAQAGGFGSGHGEGIGKGH